MSVIQTFFFMFDADTKKVQQGLKEINKGSADAKKGVEAVDESAEKLGGSFVKAAKAGGAFLAAILSVGAIKAAIGATAELTGQIEAQARALNVSTEALTTWQNVLIKIGGSASEANSTIGGLMATLRTMSVEGGQSLAMMQLGLDAADANDPLMVMRKLSDTFSTLNKSQQLYLGEKLGIDANTIELLGRGREEIDKLIEKQQRLGVVTAEQAAIAAKYREALDDVNQIWETIRREVTTAVLPVLTWLLDKVGQVVLFFRENQAFATGFFGAIATVISALLIPVLVRAAGASMAFLGPWLLIAGAVAAVGAAVGLVVDDIDAFMRGNDSVIGELAKKWPWLGDIVTIAVNVVLNAFDFWKAGLIKLQDAFEVAFEYIKAIVMFFVDLITQGPTKAIENFVDNTAGAFQSLVTKFEGVADAFKGVVDLMTDPVDTLGKAWDKVGEKGISALETIKRGPRGIAEAVGGFFGVDLLKKFDQSSDAKMSSHAPLTGTMGEKGAVIAGKLQAMGWTPEQAAGIAGSFLQESSGDHTAVNKSSGATGVGQWLGSRKKDFAEYAGKPLEQSTLDEQLAFFQHEVTAGKERSAGNKLRATTNAADAARVHRKFYERPGEHEAHDDKRVRYGEQILAAQKTVDRTSKFAAASGAAAQATTTNNNARSLTVTTGPISVATSDPKAAAEQVAESIKKRLTDARDAFDDGVAG